jgi:hypothetical protein
MGESEESEAVEGKTRVSAQPEYLGSPDPALGVTVGLPIALSLQVRYLEG